MSFCNFYNFFSFQKYKNFMKKLLIITVDKIIFSREIDQKKGECYYNKL